MARVSKLGVDNVAADIKPVFEDMMKVRGNIPNMFRTMAHRPEILKTMAAHFKAVMAPTTLSVRLKELVVLRVSAINCTDYCIASHTKLAVAAGATPEEIQGVLKGDLSKFPAKDAAAIRYGERITADSNGIPDGEFDALRGHFTEGEIVELTCAAGIFNYFNRFNNALRMEITT